MLNDIEYLGRNIFDGQLLTEKYYYHWRNDVFPLPKYLKQFLNPFDFGKRNNGFSHSISAFIKECNYDKLMSLLNYGINNCNLDIEKKEFLTSFLSIADLSNNSHYDPIISFKYNLDAINGISFYVTALKDKTLMNKYLNDVIRTLSLDSMPTITKLLTKCVESRCADMFQVAWDFDIHNQKQNKIYLKIKNSHKFLETITEEYPYVKNFVDIDGFRFCEFAFVINNNELKMFNLYYKPQWI